MKKTILLSTLLLLAAAGARGETLTLEQSLREAAAGNPTLKVRAYEERRARLATLLTQSAYYPRVDFNGGFTAMKDPQGFSIGGRTVQTQDADFPFADVSVSYTIYDFGRREARRRQALLQREAAGLSYSGAEKETFLNVVQAYYGVLEGQKLVKAADEEVAQMTDHLRVAKALHEEGVTTRNDVLQAEVRLAASRQKKISAENGENKSRLYLNFLTGRPSGYRPDLVEGAAEVAEPEACETAGISDKRPEVAALRKLVEAGELAVKESRASFYPELYTQAALDYTRNTKATEQALMMATVGFRMNLFGGYGDEVRLRQALLELASRKEALAELETRIRLEYETACSDARVARERIGLSESSIRQSEENLRINKDRYAEHVGTATEVLDAQTLLTQARVDYSEALFDYEVALARVKKAKGEL